MPTATAAAAGADEHQGLADGVDNVDGHEGVVGPAAGGEAAHGAGEVAGLEGVWISPAARTGLSRSRSFATMDATLLS